jgi:hypothetical protein
VIFRLCSNVPKIAWNDSCSCGSGKKCKRCCGGLNSQPVDTLSIFRMIASAHWIDAAISLSVRGLPIGPPNRSSAVCMCRLARIAAIIPSTLFRPSSMQGAPRTNLTQRLRWVTSLSLSLSCFVRLCLTSAGKLPRGRQDSNPTLPASVPPNTRRRILGRLVAHSICGMTLWCPIPERSPEGFCR